MKKVLCILSVLFSVQAFAQVSFANLLRDFDEGISAVERNYAGFSDKVTDRTRAVYESLKDSLRTALAGGTASFEDAFGCYLAWFKDYHLHDVCGAQDKYMPGPVDYAALMLYRPADVFCKVDDNTFLIRYTSCAWSSQRVRWTKKAVRAFRKSGCENLILDLRGNHGGADQTSRAFLELLYDHDGHYPGHELRNTAANIELFRQAAPKDRRLQRRLDACERSGDEYPTLFQDVAIHYDRISSLPVAAAILIDNQTASNAESLVLNLREISDRVLVFGRESSLGCVDYKNPFLFTLPTGRNKFRIPVIRRLGLPESGIDATGIIPDVTVDCPYPSILTDNLDEWTLWVASWFTRHPLSGTQLR